MNFNYYNPVSIDFGSGSIKHLAAHIGKRNALLVTSKGFVKRGLITKIQSEVNGIIHVVSSIKPNPEIKDLKRIYNSLKNISFDVIVALGGGSVIDSAKVFSVYNSDQSFQFVEDILRGKKEISGYNLKPIIAIPTTAGTGSELTPWATVWDMNEKKKYSLHLPDLFPEVAICDPELTLTVPKNITIQTGLDTLSHALESIWNKNASPITIQFAISSAKEIIKTLPLLANNLNSLELRTKIMLSCINAGKAFSNTATSTAHAISYYITAHKGVSHGVACSFTLPVIIDVLIGKHEWLDKVFLDIFGELSSSTIKKCFSQLNISNDIYSYGLTDNEIQQIKLSLEGNIRAKNGIIDTTELFQKLLSN